MSETILKVFIFGDGGVGKTTLINRYLTGAFKKELKMTIGVDFHIKRLNLEEKPVILQIWDFAGEERFKIMLPSYVRGSKGGLFMFDITRYSSLKNINSWVDIVRSVEKDIPLVMIGSKIDLNENRSVSSDKAIAMASEYGFYGYGECSSKTGEFVEDVFDLLAKAVLEHLNMI